MQQDQAVAYCDLMQEIRHRATAIGKLERPNREVIADFVRVESMALQIRKILELVALGSLVANARLYTRAYQKFARHYHADRILADVEKINPHFYPRPVMLTQVKEGTYHLELVAELDDSYLRRSDLATVYEKCGAILHSRNPYRNALDYQAYETGIPVWMRKIEKLLEMHLFRLVDDKNIYYFQMNSTDGRPHHSTLSPVEAKAEYRFVVQDSV